MFPINARSGTSTSTTKAPDANAGEMEIEAGPSTSTSTVPKVHPVGEPTIAISKKAKAQQPSRKKRMKSEQGREKALEREAVMMERVKGREEKKVSLISEPWEGVRVGKELGRNWAVLIVLGKEE
jgi:hypothetical protein